MKRSRRSLGILLAAMSLALGLVRATTLPARSLAAAARTEAPRDPWRGCPARAETAGATPAPLARAAHATSPPRAVSATAVIVVLPRVTALQSQSRVGWSGCSAYANGCDHLGRSLPIRTRRSPVDRLLIAGVKRVLGPLDQFSMKSASLLIQLAAPLDRRQTLASDWPELLSAP